MKAFLVMVISMCLLTGCFSESEKDKKDRQYWEAQTALLPQQIEELKKLCTAYPNLYMTYVYKVGVVPKGVMCVYSDVSAGEYKSKDSNTYTVNAASLEKEENKSK